MWTQATLALGNISQLICCFKLCLIDGLMTREANTYPHQKQLMMRVRASCSEPRGRAWGEPLSRCSALPK